MKLAKLAFFCFALSAIPGWGQIPTHTPKRGIITVAASNTPSAKKATADFVCDGTADEVQILAAVNALRGAGSVELPGADQVAGAAYNSQGGTVYFLSGEYSIDSTLTLTEATGCPHGLRLDGEAGATIFINTGSDTHGVVIDGQTTTAGYGLNRIEIVNLTFVGNFIEATPLVDHCGDLVQIIDVAYPRIEGCHFLRAGRDGLSVQTPGGDTAPQNRIITSNQALGCARHGFAIFDSHDLIFSNCHAEENARENGLSGAGVYIENLVGGELVNIQSEDNEDTGSYGTDLIIVNSGITMFGVEVDGSMDIDCRQGFDIKLNGCHANSSISIDGTNNNIALTNCDAATSLTISQSTITQGTAYLANVRAGTLDMDIGAAYLTNTRVTVVLTGDVNDFSASGGNIILGAMEQASRTSFNGVDLSFASDDSAALRAVDSVSLVGCEVDCTNNLSILGDDSCRILIESSLYGSGTITLDNAGVTNNQRLTLCSNIRNVTLDIDDMDYFSWCGGTVTGGTITVDGCATGMSMTGVVLLTGSTVTFGSNAGRGVGVGNCGSGAINIDISESANYTAASFFTAGNNPGLSITEI